MLHGIGIDPGKNGAWVYYLKFPDAPHRFYYGGIKQGDEPLSKWVKTFTGIPVMVENVHVIPTDGKVSAATFMESKAHIHTLLAFNKIAFKLVQPVVWQKYNKLVTINKIYTERKNYMVDEFVKRFPDANLPPFAVDAAFMAIYAAHCYTK